MDGPYEKRFECIESLSCNIGFEPIVKYILTTFVSVRKNTIIMIMGKQPLLTKVIIRT